MKTLVEKATPIEKRIDAKNCFMLKLMSCKRTQTRARIGNESERENHKCGGWTIFYLFLTLSLYVILVLATSSNSITISGNAL